MDLFHKSAERKEVSVLTTKLDKVNIAKQDDDTLDEHQVVSKPAYSFADLGLCDWICKSTFAMGFRKPTDIQKECIPAILNGRDVLACAETGSGKTAAFALPILQKLSEDPYGIFAIILTPTRELAIQIQEQITSLGVAFGVRIALVIGGVNITEQGIALSKRPHIVIATPGRMRHHLQSATPPDISKAMYLVLDEADRLLSKGFSSELEIILTSMSAKRKTLLFSATLTSSLEQLERLALSNALRFDLTKEQKVPARLVQQYIFMPARIKACYLVALLNRLMPESEGVVGRVTKTSRKKDKKTRQLQKRSSSASKDVDTDTLLREYEEKLKAKESAGSSSSVSSIIIFVGTCKKCAEVTQILTHMDINCVSLHGLMDQALRVAALGKFKNHVSRVLVATDVASRGLDIPSVDLVVNFDLPKISSDYIHRIGRTARAGRNGRAISFVTQYDVELVHGIEAFTGQQLQLNEEVDAEVDVVPLLNKVSQAMREAQMEALDNGSEEKAAVFRKRKRQQKRQLLRKQFKGEGGNDEENDDSDY